MNDIREIVNDIEKLKPIPPLAAQILALADDPNSSMSEFADLIIYDPSITCTLMGIGTGVDSLSYRFYSDVLKRMALTGKDLQTIIVETRENWDKIESLLSLV